LDQGGPPPLKRQFGEKYEKSEKKRRRQKKKKWKKQDYFISLTCVGVTNLTMSVGEYKKEELKGTVSRKSWRDECMGH
jgi:hypothetical protein